MTAVQEKRAATSVVPLRDGTARQIRAVLVGTAFLDALVLMASVMLAAAAYPVLGIPEADPVAGDRLTRVAGVYLVATWLLVLFVQGGYSRRQFGAGPGEFRTVIVSSLVTAGVIGCTCYLFWVPLPRSFVLAVLLLALPLLLTERSLLRRVAHGLRRGGHLVHRVIAVGGPSGVSEVVDALRRSRHAGYEVVGACVPEHDTVARDRVTVPVLGQVGNVRRLCAEYGADTVLVARGGYGTARELRRIAWQLEGSSIDLVVVPSLTDVAGPRIHMRPVAGLPLLHVEPPQAQAAAGLKKRLFDVVGASVALVVLLPLMLAIALLIWLEDRGPILFKQSRIGRDGTVFGCYKFRSMCVDAEHHEADLRARMGHSGALWKMRKDPRVTRIGTFIRRYSIDEIPQIFNVLRGEMSLVGPRPQQAWEVETYTDWEHRRLRVRPGMTGLWQVSGRSQLSFDEAIRLDLYYVDNWSMTGDLVIVAKTVGAVLGKSGAY